MEYLQRYADEKLIRGVINRASLPNQGVNRQLAQGHEFDVHVDWCKATRIAVREGRIEKDEWSSIVSTIRMPAKGRQRVFG